MTVLTVRALRAVGVEVPMTHALGTSRARVTAAPLLLVDLETEKGVTGRAYLFCYLRAAVPAIGALVGEIESRVRGERIDPPAQWDRLARASRHPVPSAGCGRHQALDPGIRRDERERGWMCGT